MCFFQRASSSGGQGKVHQQGGKRMQVKIARLAMIRLVVVFGALCPALVGAQPPGNPAPGAQAAHEAPGVIVTRHRRFGLPINLLQAPNQIQAVQLLVSTDRGTTWRIHSQQPPTAAEFLFQASQDGEYWFASKTVDLQNAAHPDGQPRAEQRIVIDSTEPQVDFSADPGADGDVRLQWKVADAQLNPSSFRLEYQAAPGDAWEPIPYNAPTVSTENRLTGEHVWWPKTQLRAVDVRLLAMDKAGNRAAASRRVFLPRSTAAPPAEPKSDATSTASNRVEPSNRFTESSVPASPRQMEVPGHSAAAPALGGTAAPALDSAPGVTWPVDNRLPGAVPATTPPPIRTSSPPPMDNPHYRPNPEDRTAEAAADGATSGESYGRVASDVRPRMADQTKPEIDATPAPSATAEQQTHWPAIAAGEPVRMTKLRQFQLEYDVEAAGTGQVAEVQLWGTEDGGTTWLKWGVHSDRQKPLEVQVDHDGMYGFRLVIVSSNGLASEIPQRGSPADLWVGVDGVAPQAEFKGVSYGTGARAAELEIQWTVSDQRLAERPMTLSFGPQREGPWTTIASGLAADGPYYWKMDPSLPPQVFLRLQCHDAAGNLAELITREPIKTAGLVPRGRIRAIRPVDKSETSAAAVSGANLQP
jgi:hypothetical protein